MPSNIITAQVFSSIYIGNYSSSSPLTLITELRTNGAEISEDLPTTYVTSEDQEIQSGNHIYTVKLEFIADTGIITRITRGLSISGNINDPISTTQYSLLLLSPDSTKENSYYLPKVRVEKVRKLSYTKRAVTTQVVTFLSEHRLVTTNLMYQGTHSYLDGIMGSKSPL